MRYVGERFPNALSVVCRILVFASLTGLASCVQPTVFPRYLTVADVINNVKCQLQEAIQEAVLADPRSTWLRGWTASFNVNLQVFRQGSGSAELTVVVPYDAPGTFRTGFFGSLAKSGKSFVTIEFDADKNLDQFMSKNQCDYVQELRGRRNLAGNTGLGLWFGNAIQGVNRANIIEQSTGLSYTLEFVTTVQGNIKPAFNRIFSPVRMFNGAFDLGRQRKDTNTLIVAFAPIEPAKPAFAETDLGKALLRIEESLAKSEQRLVELLAEARRKENEKDQAQRAYENKKASLDLPKLEKDLTDAKRSLQAFRSDRARGLVDEGKVVDQEEVVRGIKAQISAKEEQLAPERRARDVARNEAAIAAGKVVAKRESIASDQARRAAALALWRQAPAPSVTADRRQQLINQSLLRQFQPR